MIRQTSIDAYNEIKRNGLLSAAKWQVYDAMFNRGPLTRSEIDKIIGKNAVIKSYKSHVSARIRELCLSGCVREVGKRICSVSNLNVHVWELTDNLPIKLKKEIHKKIYFGSISLKFGERSKLFKTKGEALRYQMQNKCLNPILEFEIVK